MGDSKWVWRSESSKGKKEKSMGSQKEICPVCGNKIEKISDGTIKLHRDYGKDKKGNPKKTGPFSYCTYRRWF